MTWLYEDPFWLLVMIAGVIGLAILFCVTTGPSWLWRLVAGMVVVAIVVVAVEKLVVTDREQIAERIERGAEAFRRGDVQAVEDLLDPSALQIRRDVRTAMAQGRFHELRITHEDIRVDRRQLPHTAEVDLIVRGKASERNGPIEDFTLALTLTFKNPSDAWLLTDARVEDLAAMLKGHGHRP